MKYLALGLLLLVVSISILAFMAWKFDVPHAFAIYDKRYAPLVTDWPLPTETPLHSGTTFWYSDPDAMTTGLFNVAYGYEALDPNTPNISPGNDICIGTSCDPKWKPPAQPKGKL